MEVDGRWHWIKVVGVAALAIGAGMFDLRQAPDPEARWVIAALHVPIVATLAVVGTHLIIVGLAALAAVGFGLTFAWLSGIDLGCVDCGFALLLAVYQVPAHLTLLVADLGVRLYGRLAQRHEVSEARP